MFLKKNQVMVNGKLITLDEAPSLTNFIKMSGNKFTKMMEYCSRFIPNISTRDKMRKAKLTSNMAEIKELLSPDCVQAFILSGKEGCTKLLFPFLAEFYGNRSVTTKEKEAKTEQLRNDYKEAKRIANEEYDEEMKKVNLEGVKYFQKNIDSIITPYKL